MCTHGWGSKMQNNYDHPILLQHMELYTISSCSQENVTKILNCVCTFDKDQKILAEKKQNKSVWLGIYIWGLRLFCSLYIIMYFFNIL